MRAAVTDAAVGVAVADDPGGLNAFLRPGCAAALWRRHTPPDVQAWLDDLAPDALPRARVVLRPAGVADMVRRICDAAALPAGGERSWLEADIAALAGTFADLMSAPFLRMRLDAITTNACRRFHVDAITARLVCTYRGTGTQYGISTDGNDPARVFTVATGAPIVLRGTRWPEPPASGLLHRSPPIEGTGETRLVLVLDPMEGPEDDMHGM
ncbi:DUF1826 domain-containing protein [uncultured Tateyamaria sp.]|uniref:DUF1826 domain-containing protein n=1 Tax=uncultured Tateyamaria sp. TaxID=455651 RepID=UPI00262DBBBC|nr:DUF1826 domain-containing protein [uncultured Tateyamaria sp.]